MTALNLCCPTSGLAGGCTIVLGILLLSWVVVMILRLCGVGKITKEPLVRVAGIEEGDRADRVVTDVRAAEVCS
ncbi:transmembrane protein [Chlamydia abortus]|nr:transmembrane protein [Chlamydia abortus]